MVTKGKKWTKKGRTFSQLNKKNKLMKKKKDNVIDQAFLPIIDSAGVSASAASPAPASSLGRAASQDKEKGEDAFKDLSGFIFLCSEETKLDCFRFRVFGLRSNKKEIIEKIKPGTKLFLFDVELKLLYGVYEATSTGKIDLESHAFGGKFPAQVKFQIFKECLPLRESSFRHAIKDNYHGRKFEPELNGHQVRNLLSLFCPLTASTTATTATTAAVSHPPAPSFSNVGVPKIMPALAVEDQVKLLLYPQEVGPSMANVGPLNTSPAFAKEHQDESKQQPPLSTAFVDEQNAGDAVDSFEGTQDESDQQDVLSGFIFLCGGNTKHDCYRFRVFGLPSNKKERVEKIKPGTKLFLFDFELKLLYGVYEATSTGIIDLEPRAFGGKFPAQVKFRIYKECLPLPEASFRHIIKDNYRGIKFEPELSDEQVRNLLSLFHPLAASAAAAVASHPQAKVGSFFANVDMPKITPALAMEDQVKVLSYAQAKAGSSLANVPPPNTIPALHMEHHVKYSSMPTYVEDPYMTRMQHAHRPPIVESQRVYELQSAQHGWLRTTNFVETALTVADHKQLTAPGHAYSRQPYVTQGISSDIRNPYLRYRSMQGRVPWQPRLMELNDRNCQLYSRVEPGMLPPQESIVTCNYYSGRSAPYVPPVLQQYASEAVMQEGTSSISFEYSLVRRLG
ncbi:hypothetical protein HAX54_003563 [Datura stramonium]|uniref:DCD domain-containing protein n=1 Tax=Datura stramonium TaxID=4076 RepID=A0ABS8T7R0_DATST|nr:hypothetical protein [Datura stramonium]